MLLDISTFFGRFHPLIVHLPIGFLISAFLFALLGRMDRYHALQNVIPLCLLLGSISAVLACLTGYVLSLTGSYDDGLVQNHMLAGICTTIVSIIAYLLYTGRLPFSFFRQGRVLLITLLILFAAVSLTGHLGGQLTHGTGYLSLSLLWNRTQEKKITDLGDAYLFNDVIHPILQKKCSGCHNPSKRKGGLSLEEFQDILKGGRHGIVVKAGDPPGSELYARITLDPGDKKFMPSDGKMPLSNQEISIIQWWIEKAVAAPDRKFLAINPPENIKRYVAARLGIAGKEPGANAMALPKVPPVSREVISRLKQAGFIIKYIHLQPDLLDVTLVPGSGGPPVAARLGMLLQVKENVQWLNIADNGVADQDMPLLGKFVNLQRLRIDKNPVTDTGIAMLTGLQRLQSINLYSTRVSNACLASLSALPSLKTVYVWNTGVKSEELAAGALPFSVIGGYK